MSIKRETIQVGLTAREITTYENPLSADEWDEFCKFADQTTIEWQIGELEETARKTLAAAGLPTFFGPVEITDTGWREFTKKRRRGRESINRSSTTVVEMVKCEPFSRESYAAQVLLHAHCLREHMKREDMRGAINCAFQLQYFADEAYYKFRWEADTIRGRKSRINRGGAERPGHFARVRDRYERWQEIADDHSKRRPKLSKRAIARLIAQRPEETASANTIRQVIKTGRPTG